METPEKSTTEEGTDLGSSPGGSIWSRLGFDRFSALYVLVAFFIFFDIAKSVSTFVAYIIIFLFGPLIIYLF